MSDTFYASPSHYGMLFGSRRHDLGFYLALAGEAQGPVLELGVGTGRVALELARAGHEVIGVDLSEHMLAELAARIRREHPEVRERITWYQGDARTVELGRRFGLVICPFNGMAHYHTNDELGAFLHNVAAHLAPSGIFAFDVLIPDPVRMRGEGAYVPWFRDPRTGEVSRCEETVEYDVRTQVLTVTMSIRSMEADRGSEELTLRLRQFFPQETELLLDHHGFRIVQRDLDLGDVIGYACVTGRATGR